MDIEERSPEIDQLAKALSDAQAQIESAERTGKNSFIGNTYADLTSIWKRCEDHWPERVWQ